MCPSYRSDMDWKVAVIANKKTVKVLLNIILAFDWDISAPYAEDTENPFIRSVSRNINIFNKNTTQVHISLLNKGNIKAIKVLLCTVQKL